MSDQAGFLHGICGAPLNIDLMGRSKQDVDKRRELGTEQAGFSK